MSSRAKRNRRRFEDSQRSATAEGHRVGNALNYRALSAINPTTINEDERSIEGVFSTEQPVEMWDWERWESLPEVLRTDGMQMPKSGQVPLLDSHSRWSVSDQLGSGRNVKKQPPEVVGRIFFSSTAENEWTKVREGHCKDLSAGYRILEKIHVPKGQKQTIRGTEYTGPVNVVTKWQLREISLVPIGADDQAKLRGLDPAKVFSREREFTMTLQLRQLFVERGMPADLTDDEAQNWALANKERVFAGLGDPPQPANPPVDGKRDEATPPAGPAPVTAESVRAMFDEAFDGFEKRQNEKRAAFRKDIDSLTEIAGPEAVAKRSDYYALENLDAVRAAILKDREERATQLPGAPVITFGRGQHEKHTGCLRTAVLMRAFEATGIDSRSQHGEAALERMVPKDKREKGWEQFRHASLLNLASECLIADGFDIRGLSNEQIAWAALGFPQHAGLRSSGAYHTTASFPKLTQDAVNKSMMLGFEEFPATWRGPMRQGTSVADFKTIHRMQLGAVPNLSIWVDTKDHNQVSLADAEETYAVECRSAELTLSYKLLVNDDMDVISRSPFKLGDAAARTVNAAAWAQITSNPTMRDSVALFAAATGNRKRTNLTTGAGAPSATTIQTLTNLMMQMRGENTPEQNEGDDVLNLMPRYIVGPSALRTTILQQVLSISDPASNNSGVANINNNLVPVIEPLLDAASTTAWYLFAAPTRVETVEVTFLRGQESPLVLDVMDEKKLSRSYIVLQTFAAKALDHRGVQKHAGA